MSLTAFIGRCPHCGHDHGENILFDVARGELTPAQQEQLNEQFANYAKQKPHLYGGCDEITALREQVKKLKAELKSIDGALDDPRANLTLTTSEIIWELKEQIEKLKAENEDWRNNRYTSLWKLRTEDRDKTIESQRQLLLELREERGNLCAINRELQKGVEGMLEFVVRVSKQTPEKPDYWSSCSQCERNSSDAEDLLELPNAHHTVDCTQALS